MLRKKKGQARMNETIAIVFIFFVLILFGIMFFYQYQKVAIKEKNEELLGNRAMDTTLKTLFLPELICTKGEAEPEDNCFDLMKLRYAEKTFTAHLTDYYYEIFWVQSIGLTKNTGMALQYWIGGDANRESAA